MSDLLWGGVDLLLSLSLTTVKGLVDGDNSLVEDSAVGKELLGLEGSNTVLKNEIIR